MIKISIMKNITQTLSDRRYEKTEINKEYLEILKDNI